MKKKTLITIAVAVAGGAITIGVLLSQTRTASPSFIPLLPTSTQQPASGESLRLVCLDSDDRQSTIWAASPDAVNGAKQRLFAVNHPVGYPITAALSPTGRSVAYSNMTSAEHPELNGSLWIADVNLERPSGPARQIDKSIDHGWAPRWSPDGKVVAYLKTVQAASDEENYHDLYVADAAGTTKRLYSGQGSLDILPIGFTSDGASIYIDKIDDEGDQLCKVDTQNGALTQIARLSDGVSWSLSLSPDGKSVVGSILSNRERSRYSLKSWSTETGDTAELETDAPAHYTAIWTPDGSTVTTSIPVTDSKAPRISNIRIAEQPGKAPTAAKRDPLIVDWPTPGPAAPAAWAPNLMWVVVKLYREEGGALGLVRNGSSKLELIQTTGSLDFLGWVNAAPSAPPLQLTGVSFVSSPQPGLAAPAVRERVIRSWTLPDAKLADPAFTESDSINTIRLVFSRSVSPDGLGEQGKLQNVTVEQLAPQAFALVGTASLEAERSAVRITIQQPRFLTAGKYRLVVRGAGNDVVKAEDDGSLLDGDFDGKPGGDFVLKFSVSPRPQIR